LAQTDSIGAAAPDLVAAYQATTGPSGGGFKGKMKSGIDQVKKRAVALKLKHDINGLRTAIEQQHERVGMVALLHQSSGLKIAGEKEELGRIQADLEEKQGTLDSLRGTKGSGSVVRDLKREIDEGKKRQRELMIAIGGKVDRARPEIAEAAGNYRALDELHTTLEGKETELADIEKELGPVTQGSRASWQTLAKPLMYVGGTVGALLVLFCGGSMLWGLLFSRGLPDWATIPPGAQGVVYVNLDDLRDSPLYEKLQDKLPRQARDLPKGLDIDDLSEMFAVLVDGDKAAVFLRTNKDVDLEDLFPEINDRSSEEEYQGMKYVAATRYPRMYAAKLDKRTYFMAEHEKVLKKVFDCLESGEEADLDDDLRSALRAVMKYDHYMAMLVSGRSQMPPVFRGMPLMASLRLPDVIAVGGDVRSTVSLEARLIYDDKDDANSSAEEIEKGIEEMEKEMSVEEMPDQFRETAEDALDMIRRVKVYQSGNSVCVTGRWKSKKIEEMIDSERRSRHRDRYRRDDTPAEKRAYPIGQRDRGSPSGGGRAVGPHTQYQGKPLSHWIAQTRDEDRRFRQEAVEALAAMGPEAKAAIPALTEALRDKDPEVRKRALKALGKMGVDAISALAAAIGDMHADVSWRAAANALENVGADAIPALTKALHDSDPHVKAFAAVGLGKVGQAAIPALTEALRDPDHEVRCYAAFAFPVMGADAKPAIPALKEALRDKANGVAAYAASGLAHIGPEGVTVLVAALRDGDWGVRDAALWGLGVKNVVLGPEVKKAVPVLIEALGDSYETRRERAAVVVGKLGPEGKAAVPALISTLQKKGFDREVVWALGQIGPAARKAVPVLEGFRGKSPWHGEIVDEALAKIGSATENEPIVSPPNTDATESEREGAAELSAPPLKNGVILDGDLSVVVARFERHRADRSGQQGIFTRDVDGVDITLAFRRVSAQWPKSHLVMSRAFRVIITDDRGNEYSGLHCHAGSRVLYGDSFYLDGPHIMYGTPRNVEQMPVGFTWTGKIKVPMPDSAPIAKVELECKLFGSRPLEKTDTRRLLMDHTRPTMPDFEFDIPSKLLLPEGTTVATGHNLRSKMGRLVVEDSFRISRNFGPTRTEKGLSLSVPIEFANMDYNVHSANVPRLSVQFEDGEVVGKSDGTVTQSADLQDSPGTLGGVPAFEIRGKSSRTLVLRMDVAAHMNADAGLNIRRIMLYGDDGFRGFVCIPNDARKRIRAIAGKGATETVDQDTAAAENEKPATQGPLSGTWQASTGAQFRIDDDGKTITITLTSSNTLREFSGRLTRRGEKPDSKYLDGKLDVVFGVASKRHAIRATGILDDSDHLRLRCSGWPVWDKRGRQLGDRVFNEVLTRYESGRKM